MEGTVTALIRGRDIFSPITFDKGVHTAVLLGPDEVLASGFLWEENRKQLAYKPLVERTVDDEGVIPSEA